jgi:nitrite reductase (NADH) large subunit
LDTKAKKVVLAEGEALGYDSLVLAMGSHAFVPPIPGSDLDGVMSLRTAGDADAILKRARQDGRCVVIGGGILGIETAGALARQGVSVTLVESHAWLMPRQLNRKAAGLLERHMGKLGITLKKEAQTERLEGEGKVSAVCLADGERLETGVVVLATGVRSNTSLARKAGLEVHRGIVVNNHLQASADGVYAAGDVAEHNGQVYGTWAPAQFQGTIAGLNAAGKATEFGGTPRSNTLKILGIDLLSMGQFEPEDGSYRVLDHEEDHALAHFVFRDGRLVGSILMGHAALGMRVKQAIDGGEDFSALLADANTGEDVLLAGTFRLKLES